MPRLPRIPIALLLAVAFSASHAVAAADEACAGISQKCTADKPYDKTIGGTVYSCYDCKQALCKDGGSGGLSGTKTSSVCTEKATTFQPISLDGQSRSAGDQQLTPKPRPRPTPGGQRRVRNEAADPRATSTPADTDQGKHRSTPRLPEHDDGNGDDADPMQRVPATGTTQFDEADALFGPRTQGPAATKATTTTMDPMPSDTTIPPRAPSPIPVPYPTHP